jgi:BirA family biotin operon repressor/biotin-[acetyl-CoA-carboxylase] ligase
VSLLFSVLLVPSVESLRLPELTIVAGEAVREAIAAATGLAPEIKLPNDILIGGRKSAGILAEARDGRVVLGIGVNVNVPADELPEESATSLLVEQGAEADRVELLVEILDRLERHYDDWVAKARAT